MDVHKKTMKMFENPHYIFQKPYTKSNEFTDVLNSQHYFRLLPRAKSTKNLNKYIIIGHDTITKTSQVKNWGSKFPQNQLETVKRQLTNGLIPVKRETHRGDGPRKGSGMCGMIFRSVLNLTSGTSDLFLKLFKNFKTNRLGTKNEFVFDKRNFISSTQINGIPFVLDLLVSYVENYSMHVEGIYRICTSSQNVAELVLVLNKDIHDWTFESPIWEDSVVIFCLLKLVLRSFSSHFGLNNILGELMEVYSKNGRPMILVVYLINKMAEFDSFSLKLLFFILRHLSKVAENSYVNKMTATSLGVIFSPIFFDLTANSVGVDGLLGVTKAVSEITAIMIENFSAIYHVFKDECCLVDTKWNYKLAKIQFIKLRVNSVL